MKRKARIRIKLMLIIFGLIILTMIFMSQLPKISDKYFQTSGQYIDKIDAKRLIEALPNGALSKDVIGVIMKNAEKKPFLNYKEYLMLAECFLSEEEYPVFEKSYLKWTKLELKDWLIFYDLLVSVYDTERTIINEKLTVLAGVDEIILPEEEHLKDGEVYTTKGVYKKGGVDVSGVMYQPVYIISKEEEILFIREITGEEYIFKNVWVIDVSSSYINYFSGGCEYNLSTDIAEESHKEQVADIGFSKGLMLSINSKKEKITGKVLRVRQDSMEIEGYGEVPISPDVKIYQLYGMLEELKLKNVMVGYDFSDFVLENGEVQACLITRDEAMENIRVLLKTDEFADVYHNEFTISADVDYEIRYADQVEAYAGDTVTTFNMDSACLDGNRVSIVPKALTGNITVHSLNRSQGIPVYRGTLELVKTEEGILAVNELLLEEYLYAVVPSEMPSTYGEEALKTQAVCARSYAYKQMTESGCAAYGAHVDDSVSYQVYNNINENANTTKAVKETAGQVVTYKGEPIYTYYFSTSCGYTTNGEVWKGGEFIDRGYLASKPVSREPLAIDLSIEEYFTAFINSSVPSDYESSFPMYRWSTFIDTSAITDLDERLKSRYSVNPQMILTKTGEDIYESIELAPIGSIQNAYIAKRNQGGIVEEIIIEGSENTVKVITEYNIRYMLGQANAEVLKADGTSQAWGALLPSAYFIMEPVFVVEGDTTGALSGFNIKGGGYGHGAGMSQNAAKIMAEEGMSSTDIIKYFYEDVKIENLYQ